MECMSTHVSWRGASHCVVNNVELDIPIQFTLCLSEDADEKLLETASLVLATYIVETRIDQMQDEDWPSIMDN